MIKKDSFIKGVLIGIIITLTTMMFFGFSGAKGHSQFNPLYVKIVN